MGVQSDHLGQSHALALPASPHRLYSPPMAPKHQAASHAPSTRPHLCATPASGAPSPPHSPHAALLGARRVSGPRSRGPRQGRDLRSTGKVRKPERGEKATRGAASEDQGEAKTRSDGVTSGQVNTGVVTPTGGPRPLGTLWTSGRKMWVCWGEGCIH